MVLAEAVEFDVAEENDLVVALGEYGFQVALGIILEAGHQLGVGACDAVGGAKETFAIGVFADGDEDFAHGFFDAGDIDFGVGEIGGGRGIGGVVVVIKGGDVSARCGHGVLSTRHYSRGEYGGS